MSQLQSELEAHGLVLLGGFAPKLDQVVPDLSDGSLPKALGVVASAGPAMWAHLQQAPEHEDSPHPVNAWSARVIRDIAQAQAAEVVFPFDGPPYWPFQQWLMALPGMSQSPLGVVMSARYGPWFALRGALLFAETHAFPAPDEGPGPCPGCADKPCLDACPVEALTRQSAFNAGRCREHVRSRPEAHCATRGCLVRHACPWGQDYAYLPEQANHHMRAFAG